MSPRTAVPDACTMLEAAVSERDFRQQVVQLARLLGWQVYFTWTSVHSPAGFPDLVLVSAQRQRVVFAELKTERGKVTEAQDAWLGELRRAGAAAHVWRPSDLPEIERVLR